MSAAGQSEGTDRDMVLAYWDSAEIKYCSCFVCCFGALVFLCAASHKSMKSSVHSLVNHIYARPRIKRYVVWLAGAFDRFRVQRLLDFLSPHLFLSV